MATDLSESISSKKQSNEFEFQQLLSNVQFSCNTDTSASNTFLCDIFKSYRVCQITSSNTNSRYDDIVSRSIDCIDHFHRIIQKTLRSNGFFAND